MLSRIARVLLIGAAGIATVACPNRLTTDIALHLVDTSGPTITITSPEPGSPYSTVVRITGTMEDGESGPYAVGSASFEVSATSIGGVVGVADDGTFQFSFATKDGNGNALVNGIARVRISAQDLSGNESVLELELVPPQTGEVPGFSVVPGSESATITWSEIATAETYDILESSYGQWRYDVSSPYVWQDLENGDLYEFSLIARMPEGLGTDAVSQPILTMPLAGRDFMPWVRESNLEQITLEWAPNPNAARYSVERSFSPSGPWEQWRNLAASSFTDTRVEDGETYYYRVRPYEFADISSEPMRARAPVFGNTLQSIVTADHVHDVAVRGSYAYLADGLSGLTIVDVSDPSEMFVAATVDLPNESWAVDVEGSTAYVAAGNAGLAVIEVADPTNPGSPTFLTEGGDSFSAHGVDVVGDYAYVADYNDELVVFDLTDPGGTPADVTISSPGSPPKDIVVVDGFAYLAMWSGGISVVDVTTPMDPELEDVQTLSDNANGIAADGDFAYAATLDGLSVVVVNASNPPAGEATATFGAEYTSATSSLTGGIAISNGIAYLSHPDHLVTFDISDPTNPGPAMYNPTVGNTGGVEIVGDLVYAASDLGGLSVVRARNPRDTGLQLLADTTGTAFGIDVQGDYVYIADLAGGLAVVELSGGEPVGPADQIAMESAVYGVKVSGDYLFVATIDDGLAVFDLSDPGNPTNPVYAGTSGSARDLVVAGSHAYVADSSGGFVVIDVSDPASPGSGIARSTAGDAYDVAVMDSYAYVAANNAGVEVYDVSDPAAPVLVDTEDTPGSAWGIAVAGNYAYVADQLQGLAVMDISVRSAPSLVTNLALGATAHDLSIVGPYAFVAVSTVGLVVVDIADPAAPAIAFTIDTPQSARDVKVSGGYAYVADAAGGLVVIPLRD